MDGLDLQDLFIYSLLHWNHYIRNFSQDLDIITKDACSIHSSDNFDLYLNQIVQKEVIMAFFMNH